MRARLNPLGFVCLAAVASAQSPPAVSSPASAPVRPDARVVRLDLFASLDGRVVDDLTRDEIDVREDGVSQTVTTFTYVRPDAGHLAALDTRSNQTGPMPVQRSLRLVVFFDTYHSSVGPSEPARARLAAGLDAVTGPGAEIALLTSATDIGTLAFDARDTALERIRRGDWESAPALPGAADDTFEQCVGGPAPDAGASPAVEMMARRREQLTLDAIDRLVGRISLDVADRTAVVLVTDGWRLFRPNPELGRAPADRRPSRDIIRGRQAGSRTGRADAVSTTSPDCGADLAALASLDHSTRLVDLGEWANRGLLSFYPVSSAALGVVTPGPARSSAALASADESLGAAQADSLRLLAAETGGTATVDDADGDRLWRALRNDGAYYFLTYAPTNVKLDGRFRAVTVHVSRPGVRATTRRGYRGWSVAELFGDPALSRRGDGPGVSGRGPVTARLPFRIRPSSWAYRRDDRVEGGFWIVGELDFRLRSELVWSAGAEADVTVLSGNGAEVLSRTVTVPATGGGFGLRVPEDAQLPPGDYAVRVRIRPPGADDRALTDTARVVVPSTSSDLGEAVMWRRGPSTGPRFVMTADARFQRIERLRLELPADTSGPATARMLDRMRQPIHVPVLTSDRVDPVTGLRWIVADAALAPLAMGEYAVEVLVEGRRRVTTFQVVP